MKTSEVLGSLPLNPTYAAKFLSYSTRDKVIQHVYQSMARIEIHLKDEERKRLEEISSVGVCQVRPLQRAQVLLALTAVLD